MSLCLSADELAELTARTRPSSQAKVLESMGIPYRRRPDGSLVVLRAVVSSALTHAQQAREPRLRLPA